MLLIPDEMDDAITPSHLLHGRRIFNHESDEKIVEESRLTLSRRFEHLHVVVSHAKKRWREEYLTELREY